jgi:hypothetical protein
MTLKYHSIIKKFILLAMAGCFPATRHAAESSHASFNGLWLIENEVDTLLTSEGKQPPLLPEALAIYQQHLQNRRNNDPYFDRATWCASPGVPRLLLTAHPFEIMVDKRQVGFFFEWNRWIRLVDMSGAELELYYPLSFGVPSGRWEADNTLVVDTIGLMKETIMDNSGLPHSDDLVMTERLRLLDTNTLENRIRFEDPQTYSQAWETVVIYRRQQGERLQEDVCLDRIKQGKAAI